MADIPKTATIPKTVTVTYWHVADELEAEARARGDLDPQTLAALTGYLRMRNAGTVNDATTYGGAS